MVLHTLNSGMNKPAILNRYGDVLVEFSGWNSYVTMDGVSADLWSHAYNIALDRERQQVFVTWSSIPIRDSDPQRRRVRGYQLEQVVTLEGPHAVVEYYIIPNEPIKQIHLRVGLYKWYYQKVRRFSQGISFHAADLARHEMEGRRRANRMNLVQMDFSTPPDDVQVLSNQFGPYSVELAYRARSPRLYERTLLARLRVHATPAMLQIP